jgi:uncharacterized membrane protein YoaK (UPF0700 family)
MSTNSLNPDERMLYGTLLVLTFVSGLIDAGSYISLGRVFTANMTGNVVFMAFALGGAPGLSFWRSFLALLTALAGSAVAGHLDSRVNWSRRTSWLSVAFAIEAFGIAAAGSVAWFNRAHLTEPGIVCIIIALTGFAMGVRNGTIRRLSVPDLTTTVLTLTLAGLAFDSVVAGGTNSRWRIRIASILSMFLGATIGAVIVVRYSLVSLFPLATVLVAAVAAAQMFRRETLHEQKLHHPQVYDLTNHGRYS